MAAEIRTYSLSQLQAYTGTLSFASRPLIPVSSMRAASYILNPNALESDIVLAEYYENGELVAYRTVLPDMVRSKNEQPLRFAWLSGNYVHPDFRRKGISTRLFGVMEEAWNGRLMYTNYAPASRAVYDETGKFAVYAAREGERLYLRSPFYAAWRDRFSRPGLLKAADAVVDLFHEPFVRLGKTADLHPLRVTEVTAFSDDMPLFIAGLQEQSLFGRDAQTFNWIRRYPWVREGRPDEESTRYNFSLVSPFFRNHWYEIRRDDGSPTGFVWIMVNGKKLMVPYLLSASDCSAVVTDIAASLAVKTMIAEKAAYLLVRNRPLEQAVKKLRAPFLLHRTSVMNYYVHRELQPLMAENGLIHDGDGDCVFT
ncbi:MAG: GNAT family N-acetyltransferase [Bacteroidota bacterium]